MALYLASTLNYPNFATGGGGGGAPTGPAGGALAGTYPNPTLAPSGVTAGFYGSGTQIPRITVNAAGQVTNVLQVPIDSRAVFYPYATKSTGAGDINLNSTDTFLQYLIGTSPTQIVRLPDTSTLPLGRGFRIQSYHNGTLLIRTFSDVQIGVLSFSGHADFVCVSVTDNSLSAWDSHLVNGRQNIQFGEGAVAIAPLSSAVGAGANAGQNATAFGQQALAQANGSSAFGQQAIATLAANNGLAFGKSANASAQQATALGSFASATLPNSVALGSGAVVTDPRFLLSINLGGAGVENWNNGQGIGVQVNGIGGYIPFLQDPVPSKLSFSAQTIAQAGGTTNFTGVEPTVTVFTGAGGQIVNLFGFATPLVDIGIMYRFYNKGSGNVTIRAANSADIVILGPNNGVELVAIDYVDTPAGWFVSAL